MSERRILHSDADCFYASVETVLDPTLRGKPIAVCGSTSERHGIVLAKSYIAKRAGIRTGMTNAEAKKRCPSLIIVPPHFERYSRFSAYLRGIRRRSRSNNRCMANTAQISDTLSPYRIQLKTNGITKKSRAAEDRTSAARFSYG